MRKGFLIYEELRKYLVIYEEVVKFFLFCYQCTVLGKIISFSSLFGNNYFLISGKVACSMRE
jgi:hypothetical protein